ncbi:hypothetical protein [Streptomyces sp. 2P-4]|nr:hypothetical protein [Streptomyces sp. 2P-4]
MSVTIAFYLAGAGHHLVEGLTGLDAGCSAQEHAVALGEMYEV